MGMRAGLSGCVASARFIRRARHGYDQPPQQTAKREGKRRRQYEKNSILHLPGVRQHFDRDGRRGNRLLRQKAWRHEGAGMRRNARASCRGDGRRMVCDAESPDDKSAFHPLYRVRRGCIPNRMPRCACRKCRMRRGISDAAKTACTHAG